MARRAKAKRKGYQSGGYIDAIARSNRERQRQSDATSDVFPIIRGMMNANEAMADEAKARNYRPRPAENSDLNKAKGGKVRKVVRRGKKS